MAKWTFLGLWSFLRILSLKSGPFAGNIYGKVDLSSELVGGKKVHFLPDVRQKGPLFVGCPVKTGPHNLRYADINGKVDFFSVMIVFTHIITKKWTFCGQHIWQNGPFQRTCWGQIGPLFAGCPAKRSTFCRMSGKKVHFFQLLHPNQNPCYATDIAVRTDTAPACYIS